MNFFIRSTSVAACAVLLCLLTVEPAAAQFSKPVIVLKGTVCSEETSQPISASVSIRAVGDTAREITSSKSNRLSGRYLVILNPSKEYWVHVEGDSIVTNNFLICTPEAQITQNMIMDFIVIPRKPDAMKKEVVGR